MEEVRRTRKGIDYIAKVLKVKKTVTTRAVFWRIPHTTGDDDISLKLGRYRRTDTGEEVDVGSPKSELTLEDDEFRELAEFLADHYEALREGARKYLVLGSDLSGLQVEQMRSLFGDPDREKVVDFLLANDVPQEDLLHALDYRRKADAVQELEECWSAISSSRTGSTSLSNTTGSSAVMSYGCLTSARLMSTTLLTISCRPTTAFSTSLRSSGPVAPCGFGGCPGPGHYVPHSDLTKAITQSQRYIYEVEREANSVKTLERVGGVKVVKPRCTLIFGRSQDWTHEQTEAYRILNAGHHSLSILTYDHVLERARRMLSIATTQSEAGAVDSDIPF